MMTDRELLELAAKAYLSVENYTNAAYMRGFFSNWNPLTDDGDALRLAVKLGLDLNTSWDEQATAFWGSSEIKSCSEDHKGNPYAATRQAIVRAAAEIGEQMP